MVEEMSDRLPERFLVRFPLAHVAERGGETLGGEARHPRFDLVVRPCALPPQLLEVAVKLLVQRVNPARPHPVARERDALEAPHPNTVREEQVVERTVDRLEKRSPVSLPLIVGELRRHGVHLPVHPAVVARESSTMIQGHRFSAERRFPRSSPHLKSCPRT